MNWLIYILVAALAYLLGSSNMAFYLSKLRRVEMRSSGSGNLGTSNALILLGWKAGILVCIHDIGKAFLAVFLAQLLCPQMQYIGAVAGVAAVIGHIFPFYLRFKGGKGFASYLGMTIALNWRFAIIVLVLVVLVTLVSDYIVVGTMTTILVVPAYFGYSAQSLILPAILCLGSLTILCKHRENFTRLLNGTEIGFRSASRGDNRS